MDTTGPPAQQSAAPADAAPLCAEQQPCIRHLKLAHLLNSLQLNLAQRDLASRCPHLPNQVLKEKRG